MFMKPLHILCLAFLFVAGPVAGQTVFVVDAETWSTPRSAGYLIQLTPLREAVATLQGGEQRRLTIRHPESEQGEFWAAELRDWLVALGVPSLRIHVEGDASVHEQLDLVIRP
jgi:hypothetical protein